MTIRMQPAWRSVPISALLGLMLIALGGCSAGQPAQTVPNIVPGVKPGTVVIGICYSALVSDSEAVQAAARRACGTDGEPHLALEDRELTCPLTIPTRATFTCGTPPAAQAAGQPTQTSPNKVPGLKPGTVVVGLCYSTLVSDHEAVQAAAHQACGSNGEPHLALEDRDLTCPVVTPTRATFTCGTPPAKP